MLKFPCSSSRRFLFIKFCVLPFVISALFVFLNTNTVWKVYKRLAQPFANCLYWILLFKVLQQLPVEQECLCICAFLFSQKAKGFLSPQVLLGRFTATLSGRKCVFARQSSNTPSIVITLSNIKGLQTNNFPTSRKYLKSKSFPNRNATQQLRNTFRPKLRLISNSYFLPSRSEFIYNLWILYYFENISSPLHLFDLCEF